MEQIISVISQNHVDRNVLVTAAWHPSDEQRDEFASESNKYAASSETTKFTQLFYIQIQLQVTTTE